MGDISDSMLDGTCCVDCGEYLGSSNGFATSCCRDLNDGDGFVNTFLGTASLLKYLKIMRSKSKSLSTNSVKSRSPNKFWKNVGVVSFLDKMIKDVERKEI